MCDESSQIFKTRQAVKTAKKGTRVGTRVAGRRFLGDVSNKVESEWVQVINKKKSKGKEISSEATSSNDMQHKRLLD